MRRHPCHCARPLQKDPRGAAPSACRSRPQLQRHAVTAQHRPGRRGGLGGVGGNDMTPGSRQGPSHERRTRLLASSAVNRGTSAERKRHAPWVYPRCLPVCLPAFIPESSHRRRPRGGGGPARFKGRPPTINDPRSLSAAARCNASAARDWWGLARFYRSTSVQARVRVYGQALALGAKSRLSSRSSPVSARAPTWA
jgi:hypothetical protein